MPSSGARILMLAAGVDSPSVRFRLRQYLPYLQAQGIQAAIGELSVPHAQRRALLARCGEYDVVLVHRALLRTWDYWLLQHYARSYVFDFDDAIMFRDSARRQQRSWPRLLRFRRMARGARTVIAGNAYLKTWAVRVNARTVVVPTSIELNDYPAVPSHSANGPIIGWIGTRVNLMYLETLRGVFAQLGRSPHNPRLKVVCDAFPTMPGIEVIPKVWTLAEESADVSSFQIGIMPLPDDIWTRGKCGLKLLQYMAASLPVVCSPVGVNGIIVQDGKNGFHACSEMEWSGRLETLLGDADLRAQMGQAGRATVEAHYSVAGNVERFVQALC